jgi:hypothetical protein
MGLVYGELLQISRQFLEILASSIANGAYGLAKIFEKCPKDAARLHEINPLLRLVEWYR